MKRLTFSRIFTSISILTGVIGIVLPANAFTVNIFTERESWESSIESDFREETFDSFTVDTSFNGVNLDVGDFNLQGSGNRQKIDVPNFDVPAFSVNGSPMILGQTDGISSFTITFDSPITAFGSDLDDITSQGSTQILANTNVVGTIPLNTNFFGFTADESFTSLIFSSSNDDFDGFGADNFVYVPSSIYSSPSRSRSIASDVVNPFVPVEFSPSHGIQLTFENTRNNTSIPTEEIPFKFSPTLGLLSIGGMFALYSLQKRFAKSRT